MDFFSLHQKWWFLRCWFFFCFFFSFHYALNASSSVPSPLTIKAIAGSWTSSPCIKSDGACAAGSFSASSSRSIKVVPFKRLLALKVVPLKRLLALNCAHGLHLLASKVYFFLNFYEHVIFLTLHVSFLPIFFANFLRGFHSLPINIGKHLSTTCSFPKW